jgi:hypothetical protein
MRELGGKYFKTESIKDFRLPKISPTADLLRLSHQQLATDNSSSPPPMAGFPTRNCPIAASVDQNGNVISPQLRRLGLLSCVIQKLVFDLRKVNFMRLTGFLLLSSMMLGLVGTSETGAEPAEKSTANQAVKPIRVGVYDSRGVALAYYRQFFRSPEFVARIKKLKEERDQAKAAGDQEKTKKLEAEGKAMQEQSHLQVFGSAPIDEIVAKIKNQLPEIAKQAGVDLIVSKWSLAYQSPNAQFVDVTEQMAKPFHPDEKTWKMIRDDLSKHPPISAEELKKHPDL